MPSLLRHLNRCTLQDLCNHSAHVPSIDTAPLVEIFMSLLAEFRLQAQRTPDNVAIVYADGINQNQLKSITYQQLSHSSAVLSEHLKKMGVSVMVEVVM